MIIYVNDKKIEVKANRTLLDIKKTYKPYADLIIYNGFAQIDDMNLKEGDKVYLLKRGQVPDQDEFEHTLMSRHTPGVHSKVSKCTVGIAGLGGLGSNVAVMLARLGIKKLILVDFDVVEPSNLNRQHYFIGNLGMKKTEAMKSILKEINPFVEVETVDAFLDETNIQTIFEQTDIIVEAFDLPVSKALLINTVLHTMPRHYIIAASGLAGYYSNNTITTKRHGDKFYLVGDDISEARPGCGLMAPRTTIAAGHQANTVLRIIMGDLEVE